MAKSEPYDRTGLANESFELPHISDREGKRQAKCLFKAIMLWCTSDLSLTRHLDGLFVILSH